MESLNRFVASLLGDIKSVPLIIWLRINGKLPRQLQRSTFDVKFRIIFTNITNRDINWLVSAAYSELRCLVEFVYSVVHLLSTGVRRALKFSCFQSSSLGRQYEEKATNPATDSPRDG